MKLCQLIEYNMINIIYKKKQPLEVFFVKRPQACNFIKKETLAQVFSCEFCEISKNTFFTEHLLATASSLSNENTQDEIHADNIEKESTIQNSAFANKKLGSSSSITSKNATTISRNTLLINSTDFNANGNNKKFSRNS